MQRAIDKIGKGEYLYQTTKGHMLRVKRNFYNGNWDVWPYDALGAPAFALGFRTKKEATEYLDNNILE